jgi:hypothetical protein
LILTLLISGDEVDTRASSAQQLIRVTHTGMIED